MVTPRLTSYCRRRPFWPAGIEPRGPQEPARARDDLGRAGGPVRSGVFGARQFRRFSVSSRSQSRSLRLWILPPFFPLHLWQSAPTAADKSTCSAQGRGSDAFLRQAGFQRRSAENALGLEDLFCRADESEEGERAHGDDRGGGRESALVANGLGSDRDAEEKSQEGRVTGLPQRSPPRAAAGGAHSAARKCRRLSEQGAFPVGSNPRIKL